jgi:hypothetical protein
VLDTVPEGPWRRKRVSCDDNNAESLLKKAGSIVAPANHRSHGFTHVGEQKRASHPALHSQASL